MKTLKHHLSNIIAFILFILLTIALMIPFLNAFLTLRAMKQTIKKWTNYKQPLWLYSGDVKITICDGKDNITIYDGKLSDLEFSEDRKHKIICNTEIKYVAPLSEKMIEIRLWNESKINKAYGITNEYK